MTFDASWDRALGTKPPVECPYHPPKGRGPTGLRSLYCSWPRGCPPYLARPSHCTLASLELRGATGGATMTSPVCRAQSGRHPATPPCSAHRLLSQGRSPHATPTTTPRGSGPSLWRSPPSRCPKPPSPPGGGRNPCKRSQPLRGSIGEVLVMLRFEEIIRVGLLAHRRAGDGSMIDR